MTIKQDINVPVMPPWGIVVWGLSKFHTGHLGLLLTVKVNSYEYITLIPTSMSCWPYWNALTVRVLRLAHPQIGLGLIQYLANDPMGLKISIKRG